MASLIEKKLAKLQIGTRVELTYEEGGASNQKLSGVVTDTDNESSIEITPDGTQDGMILDFCLIRGVRITETAAPASNDRKEEPEPKQQAPAVTQHPAEAAVELEDILNLSDREIAKVFEQMPLADRKKLNAAYDSFRYGIKNTDAGKMRDAAQRARLVLMKEYRNYYDWSREASVFVGGLLRRVDQCDFEVYAITGSFREAAYAALRQKKYEMAQAYAILAIEEPQPKDKEALYAVLTEAVCGGTDSSGLDHLLKHEGENSGLVRGLLQKALAAKGFPGVSVNSAGVAVRMLGTVCSSTEAIQEIARWEAPAREEEDVKQQEPVRPIFVPEQITEEYGYISRLNWTSRSGVITGDDGKTYQFTYNDIQDEKLRKELESCFRADLNGRIYSVRFRAAAEKAADVRVDQALVDRARKICVETTREDRFEAAFRLCKRAVFTADRQRAMQDLIKNAMAMWKANNDLDHVREALEICEKNRDALSSRVFDVMDVARCYGLTDQFQKMLDCAEPALRVTTMTLIQRIAVVSNYCGMIKAAYLKTGDKSMVRCLQKELARLLEESGDDLMNDRKLRKTYQTCILPCRIYVECVLGDLEEAEADYAWLPKNDSPEQAELLKLLEETRRKYAPAKPEPEKHIVVPEDSQEFFQEESQVQEEEEDIPAYQDEEGWRALGRTAQEAIAEALQMDGPNRLAPMLAALHAGAAMNPSIAPVCRTVAMAVNDPMEAPDYSLTALVTAFAEADPDYPRLNDSCLAAAMLRSLFSCDHSHDYGSLGMRESMTAVQQLPALRAVYETLEQFQKQAGCPVDIYADYRSEGGKQLELEKQSILNHARELYTKFILTPPREGAKFARLLATKKVVFARDGYLARMLEKIISEDAAGLEEARAGFVSDYLNGADQIQPRRIREQVIDAEIEKAWNQAGRDMRLQQFSATLQGNRRNNLRSNISEILGVICSWYALQEQGAGLTWRTDAGVAAYQALKPCLMEQLEQLSRECEAREAGASDAEERTGLYLVGHTARELKARLEGSWRFGQEKYFYADFLRSSEVLLDGQFLPDLSGTFCALPRFNILERIRRHAGEPGRSFREQLEAIYGRERTCSNYGTAGQILEYLRFMGRENDVRLPDNAESYISATESQTEMRFRNFLEQYALAVNCGRIIKSDSFCYTLEDTIRFWYHTCRTSRNFGFINSLMLEAEEQIRISAGQYEGQLTEQLSGLIESNHDFFETHPDYADAIRGQISDQNFTVAEDWMARIRVGDLQLELQQPEALGYLERFWSEYPDTYMRVSEAGRTLASLADRVVVRNKDSKGAQQLVSSWLSNGNPTTPERMSQLLQLLGWKNLRVRAVDFDVDGNTELYEVRREVSPLGMPVPQHPIAAFGSGLFKSAVYAVCLYGVYDCDRLLEKMRALDMLNGSKIILVDYALGQAERRALARNIKKRECGLRNTYMVIDRVLIAHLARHYNASLISRMLMATTMPFSYCQPYVVESAHTMPPEIFIGRKDELLKIESPEGVNLIYGGRQLGKSALFKKAVSDLDGYQGQRAILIGLDKLDCRQAAARISQELIDLGIIPDAKKTEDWEELGSSILSSLRRRSGEISYFLLMLDEADIFIRDCASCGYQPLVILKNIQQALAGQFKFVLAGLHDIVKFNREVALGNNAVITHMPSLKITPFQRPEALELLTGPLSYLGFSLPSKVTASQIIVTCNYFPGLIQLYAKKLIESIRTADYAGYNEKNTPPYVISDDHLRRVLADREFVDQIREKIEITLKLDEDQGSYYQMLTLLISCMYSTMPSKAGYTARDVLFQARQLKLSPLAELDEDKIDALLGELQDLNILRSVSGSSYLLTSKNIRDLFGSDEEAFQKLDELRGAAQ